MRYGKENSRLKSCYNLCLVAWKQRKNGRNESRETEGLEFEEVNERLRDFFGNLNRSLIPTGKE
jgi:hypothetical protein